MAVLPRSIDSAATIECIVLNVNLNYEEENMKNLFDVNGKVAVVTGGSRGIGAMIARGFVENGVKTYITARREEELQATASELA